MIRPWDQDERPTWRAVAEWGSPRENYDENDLRLLAKTLKETGMTRQVVQALFPLVRPGFHGRGAGQGALAGTTAGTGR